jgi:hypothetical protein
MQIVYINTPAKQEKEFINLITHLQLQLVLKKSHRKKEREKYSEVSSSSS